MHISIRDYVINQRPNHGNINRSSGRVDASRTVSVVTIAIIGSSGYIGSRLMHHLRSIKSLAVVGYDRIFPGEASYEIQDQNLRRFHVVIYLGGLTGRAACRERSTDVEYENIGDIYALAKRMLPSQLLIFASTSAIAEGSGSTPLSEDSVVQSHIFDSYTSSLKRREDVLRNLSSMSNTAPQMIGLRFGTVIGLSFNQRIDLAHMALICQGFLGGRLHVNHPESNRAWLCMEDLIRAITVLINQSKNAKKFDIFHLQSFSSSISNVANSISRLSGAYINVTSHASKHDSFGFSLNSTKFQSTFDFTFEGNQDSIISRLIDDVPRMCLGRQSRIDNNSIPCVVCGSREMYTVLDLHTQPLANDFKAQKNESINCKRFPLRLVRCSKCHHAQLSYVVDRNYLFSHYLYQSGTTQSLKAYFEWLAEKVIDESGGGSGTVVEIACNDGSQLNQFLKRGWKTIGVDPANNLAELARAQGHTIYTGFWGTDKFSQLPSPDTLGAIIAQNVLAHVATPVEFMRACVAAMGSNTRLYIQTSQCEMYETGQFDTVYHEHVSFFTAHSFKRLADLVNLSIINFEITPIHGRSCLVTLQRNKLSNSSFLTTGQNQLAPSLATTLQKEINLGMTETWFYVKYQAQALAMRQWIVNQLSNIHEQGHTIVAYGAAAKGMVLLHYLLEISDRSWSISYVCDDAPLKQNTYCPGTSIPVRPTSELAKSDPTKPLTIIVFAWNFWNEISVKIRNQTIEKGIKSVFVIIPFPHQRLIKLNLTTSWILTQNSYMSLPWPHIFPSPRLPVVLISHFFNEEFLLPFWIRHHAPMFDHAILINYNSSDRSLQIIRSEAPRTWKIVSSRNAEFSALDVDEEVSDYERTFPKAWKIALNTPEFLVHPNLRQMLAETEHSSNILVIRFRSIIMSGDDAIPFQRFVPLLKQRSHYTWDPADARELHGETPSSRFIHRHSLPIYNIGRHSIRSSAWQWAPIGFIAKYQYTPWPDIVSRKLQIRTRIPLSDFAKKWGIQHNTDIKQLEQNKANIKKHRVGNDLKNYSASSDEFMMMHRLWREITNN
ncbi:unnamed protein product [Rotaria socialis]|uniref:Uncharacterized protein n=1 Tax=Rotaria socialis TaxID=392032 RepID=A0A821NGR4_9BILA|nr:unnamed protein product [Rotaria socialis]CAF4787589.1 unnamed protein product [Rotaria socialis]